MKIVSAFLITLSLLSIHHSSFAQSLTPREQQQLEEAEKEMEAAEKEMEIARNEMLKAKSGAYISREMGKLKKAMHDTVSGTNKLDSINTFIYDFLLQQSIKIGYLENDDLKKIKGFSYLVSEDGKLALASWDTHQGGTMIDYVTVALYKTPSGIKAKRLTYSNANDNLMTYFTSIYSLVKNDGTTLYFAYGLGQGSSSVPFRMLKAFEIKEDISYSIHAFAGEEDEDLWVYYDTKQFSDTDSIADIIFQEDKTEIKVPELSDEGVHTGKYITWKFNGSVYEKQDGE